MADAGQFVIAARPFAASRDRSVASNPVAAMRAAESVDVANPDADLKLAGHWVATRVLDAVPGAAIRLAAIRLVVTRLAATELVARGPVCSSRFLCCTWFGIA